jgi:hypothetical protein
MKSTIHWVDKETMMSEVLRHLRTTNVVLDIGCGIRPQELINPKIHICCEPFHEYVTSLQSLEHVKANRVVIQASWQSAVSLFPSASVDTVFLLDVIEHVEKPVAIDLLASTCKLARQQVVVFTPLGLYPQEHVEGRKDRWGMNGGVWQAHQSAWLPQDFDDSWTLVCVKDFHFDDGYGHKFDPPIGVLWAIRDNAPIVAADDPKSLREVVRAKLRKCFGSR